MANWALVENNKIVEAHDLLPKSWRNISGLRLSADNLEFLKTLGWYPVVKNHQEYDKTLYRENGVNRVFENDQVRESLILVEKEVELPAPQPPFEQLKHDFMVELRRERNVRLLESDWTQLYDVLSNMDNIEKSKWIIYRQQLRDLPANYAENEIVSLNDVEWPNFDMIQVDENPLMVSE
jgi:hypothetical protein